MQWKNSAPPPKAVLLCLHLDFICFQYVSPHFTHLPSFSPCTEPITLQEPCFSQKKYSPQYKTTQIKFFNLLGVICFQKNPLYKYSISCSVFTYKGFIFRACNSFIFLKAFTYQDIKGEMGLSEYLWKNVCMDVCIVKKKRNAKRVASGYTKPNKRRATLHKQKREWRERDEKTEKKSRG